MGWTSEKLLRTYLSANPWSLTDPGAQINYEHLRSLEVPSCQGIKGLLNQNSHHILLEPSVPLLVVNGSIRERVSCLYVLSCFFPRQESDLQQSSSN